MNIKFIDLINNPKSIGKVYANEEMMGKLLRNLPRNVREVIAVTIEEV